MGPDLVVEALVAGGGAVGGFHANQLRLLLSGLAHTLVEGMRRMALSATDLAKASLQDHPAHDAQGRGRSHVQHPPGAPADGPLAPRPGIVPPGRRRPRPAAALNP